MPKKKTSPKNVSTVEIELRKLKEKHKNIDVILSDIKNPILDPLILRRLKKEKLLLKDKIQKMKSQITPNIIA